MAAAVSGLFSDARPRDRALTLLIASVITAAICVPLAVAAFDARDDAPAASTGISLVTAEGSIGAGGAVLLEGTEATILVDDPDVLAIAWALHAVDSGSQDGSSDVSPLAGGEDRTAPLEIDAAIAALAPGSYDLLITATTRAGAIDRRAAQFTIEAN